MGSFERYVHIRQTVLATTEAEPAAVTVTVGRAHSLPDSAPQAHVVEYHLPEESGMDPLRIVVVAEDGGYAVCSLPQYGA